MVLLASAGVVLVVIAGAFMLLRGKKETPAIAGPAKITVRASQPQATILIDDKPCGTGSCEMALAPGQHRVEGKLEGFAPAALTLDVKPGETNHPPVELTLTANPPSVTISPMAFSPIPRVISCA